MKMFRVMLLATGLVLAAAGAARAQEEEEGGGEPLRSPKQGWIQLLNGKDLTGWSTGSKRNSGRVEKGVLINSSSSKKRGSNIFTTRKFKNFKLHIEFKVSKGGNSGVYLRGRKEVQVHASYGVKALGSGHCGGIYSKAAPSTNACKKADEWQTFDITIVGRKITVVLNGTTIIDGVVVNGVTGGAMDRNEDQPGRIMLQGDHSNIRYRNIYLKPIK